MTGESNPGEVFQYDATDPPGPRPDIIDLIGPWFDRPGGEPAAKTLVICAAARTGSYELARMLMAAGIGVAHEYFHPNFAGIIASRWGLPATVLASSEIGNYIAELRRRRSAGGVFATKLQHWQYRRSLCNDFGRTLFQDAVVVHLFRADVAGQFASLIKAVQTGRYDFSDRATQPPRSAESFMRGRALLDLINALINEDAGFRRLFLLSGIRPIFVEFNRLIREPRSIVEEIAHALAVPVNREALDQAVALTGAYAHQREKEEGPEKRLSALIQKLAFQP